jgi:negative regulator of sigma E activity
MPDPRSRTTPNKAAAAALLLALPAVCAGAGRRSSSSKPPPPVETLLDWSLEGPTSAYRGRMMFTQWFGKQARAEDVEVYHEGDRVRREFLAPDGTPARVIVSDGERQEVHLVKKGKVLRGDAVKSYEKLMPPERERELLLKNYRLTASGPQDVAGRACWILEIAPLVAGKPEQRLWIDQDTHVVLENKRLLPGRAFAAMVRYTRFTPAADLDDSLFELDDTTAAKAGKGLEPDFMTLEQLNAETGKHASLPAELPAGFVFESADFFTVNKSTVSHARYTDGLSVLSVFLTDKPVRLPKGAPAPQSGLPGASLRLSSAGRLLQFRRGRAHYTLVGDVSKELLQRIAKALQ